MHCLESLRRAFWLVLPCTAPNQQMKPGGGEGVKKRTMAEQASNKPSPAVSWKLRSKRMPDGVPSTGGVCARGVWGGGG